MDDLSFNGGGEVINVPCKDWIRYMEGDWCEQAREQFRNICQRSIELETCKKFNFIHGQEKKNRYASIKPYQHSAIILSGKESYINASKVCTNDCTFNKCSCDKIYIATQGPIGKDLEGKDSTIGDFWRMCIQYKVSLIINLTKCYDSGKEKCAYYWPKHRNDKETHISGDNLISVGLNHVASNDVFEERKLHVTMHGQESYITHLHFQCWPDLGCPNHEDFLKFYNRFATLKPDHDVVVIHCSAGVGRTGTFILIDTVLKNLSKFNEDIDMYDTLMSLRRCRCELVETQEQYIFSHEMVFRWLRQRV